MKALPIFCATVVSLAAGLVIGFTDRHAESPALTDVLLLVLPVVLGAFSKRWFWLVPFPLTLGCWHFYSPGSGVSAVGASMFLMGLPLIIAVFWLLAFAGRKLARRLFRVG